MRLPSLVFLFIFLGALPAVAKDITGTWQGSLPSQPALTVSRTASGYRGDYYRLGPKGAADPSAMPVSVIRVTGRLITFNLDHRAGAFRGTMSTDGKNIVGTWNDGAPQPLVFTRAPADFVLDASPHKVRFVAIDKHVRLEVLDWGGKGPALVFLPGWGNTAHVFDSFAPRFTARHHVFGITRRGFGLSTVPIPTRENYDPDRLGDDVLAVIAKLNLDRPILAGHSVAGQEMSSIGTRHPETVSGLIYLDAAFANMFYNPNGGYTVQVEVDDMRRKLETLPRGVSEDPRAIAEVLAALPRLQKSLERDLAMTQGYTPPAPGTANSIEDRIADVMATTRRKYVGIKPPFLAVIAYPSKCHGDCNAEAEKIWEQEQMIQADTVAADYPQATVLKLPGADHYVFRSNEAEVEHAMNAFMENLARQSREQAQ